MTPAIRQLKKNKCIFEIHKYEHDPECLNFGDEAVERLNIIPEKVFKTLVVQLKNDEMVVGVISVKDQLCLKKIAKIFKAKKAFMADKDKVQNSSGYILGGVSPFGQKKKLKTILDLNAFKYDTIFVSGGKRGLDIEIKPNELIRILNAKSDDISAV